MHVVLARYDDHLSFYRLEQQFRERHGIVIPRQQMVQWAEHIATWLRPIYDAMWKAMLAGGYLQIDETPVKVLDPDVKGKAARGYLWFYAVPGGDVILEFDPSRGMAPVRKRLDGLHRHDPDGRLRGLPVAGAKGDAYPAHRLPGARATLLRQGREGEPPGGGLVHHADPVAVSDREGDPGSPAAGTP